VPNVEFCEFAEPPEEFRKFIREGRVCKIDDSLCFNWDKPIHEKCEMKKLFEGQQTLG